MADIYCTVTELDAFSSARGYIHPQSNAKKFEALLIASEWVDSHYRSYFMGLKTGGRDQVREWPRTGHYNYYDYLIPSDEIPQELRNAVCILAHYHLTNPGVLDAVYTPSLYEQVSVDGAIAVKYAKFSSVSEIQTQFQMVADFLSGLFQKSATMGANGLSGSTYRT